VERRYPEVRLSAHGGAFDLARLLDDNRQLDLFVGIPLSPAESAAIAGRFVAWPVGFANRLVPRDRPFTFEDYLEASRAYRAYDPPAERDVRGDPWSLWIWQQYWAREQARAERLALEPIDSDRGVQLVRHAAEALERLLRLHPRPPLRNYRTLGFAYSKLARIEPAYRRRMAEVLTTYLSIHPSDPDAARIESLIRTAGE
jgi:hypothetical protein